MKNFKKLFIFATTMIFVAMAENELENYSFSAINSQNSEINLSANSAAQKPNFTLRNVNGDIGNSTDSGAFFSTKTTIKDFDIIAKIKNIDAIENGEIGPNSKSGIAFRENCDANARNITFTRKGENLLRINFRKDIGGSTTGKDYDLPADFSGEIFLRMSRLENRFTAYFSLNGLEWNYIDGANLEFSAEGEIGAILFAANSTSEVAADFEKLVAFSPRDFDGDGIADYEEIYKYFTNPESEDSDSDGLSDFDEIFTHQTNPTNADSDNDGISDFDEIVIHQTNPNLIDSDGDGFSDADEIALGTNPNHKYNFYNIGNSVSEIETDENNPEYFIIKNISGDIWGNADSCALYSLNLDSRNWDIMVNLEDFLTSSGTLANNAKCGIAFRENAQPNAKNIVFSRKSDTNLRITYRKSVGGATDGKDYPYNGEKFLRMTRTENRFSCMASNDGISWQIIDSATIISTATGEIGAIISGGNFTQSELPIITKGIFNKMQIFSPKDTDNDGVNDYEEVNIYKTNPKSADSDEDGLSDYEEIYVHFTNPNLADSDADGISDIDEILAGTNPNEKDESRTIATILTINGKDFSQNAGVWTEQGNSIICEDLRGFAEFTANVPNPDIYQIKINAGIIRFSNRITTHKSAVQVFVDELFIYSFNVPVNADGILENLVISTPFLQTGEHKIRILWENVNSNIALQVNSLELQEVGGIDANDNGKKDWVDFYLNSRENVKTANGQIPLESCVSPMWIEGKSEWFNALRISNNAENIAAKMATNNGFFVKIPLQSEDENNVVFNFQTGAKILQQNVQWKPLNLFSETISPQINLRVGDSIKLSAMNSAAETENENVSWNIAGVNSNSAQSEIITKQFLTAGNFIASAQIAGIFKQILVKVTAIPSLDFTPVVLLGRERNFTISGLQNQMTLEFDNTVKLRRDSNKIYLNATETNKPHPLTMRDSDGNILNSIELKICWLQAGIGGFVEIVDEGQGYDVRQTELFTKKIPANCRIQIRGWLAGVTLDDGNVERWITPAEFDEIQRYTFNVIHPDSLKHAACHTIRLYQGETMVGECIYGPTINGIK